MGQFFGSPNQGYNDSVVPAAQADVLEQRKFITKVFGWMTVGLAVSAIVGLLLDRNPQAVMAIGRDWILVAILQIGLAMGLGLAINRISAALATLLFLAFSASFGLTLSVVMLIFTRQSIYATFFVTAGTFGSMAAFGYVTKRDLTSVGHMAGMALWGIVIAMVVNMFMGSAQFQYLISILGVVVFVALTAYDTQKIKYMYMVGADGSEVHQKAAIMGALQLYLDFINLFMFMLQFMGQRRD